MDKSFVLNTRLAILSVCFLGNRLCIPKSDSGQFLDTYHNQWRILALCLESYNLLPSSPEATKQRMSAPPMPPKKRPHSVRTLPREMQQSAAAKPIPVSAR